MLNRNETMVNVNGVLISIYFAKFCRNVNWDNLRNLGKAIWGYIKI